MARRSSREIKEWKPFRDQGRDFVRGIVPRGNSMDQEYTIAQPLAGRYKVKRYFASGGLGLLLAADDVRTTNEVLIKTTLDYQVGIEAGGRDQDGFTRKVWSRRQQLQSERRILTLLRNAGCTAVPNPNDYVFDRNPRLAGPYATDDQSKWTYEDQEMLNSEPYLVMEMIDGQTLEDLLEDRWPEGMDARLALEVMAQVGQVLARLHQPFHLAGGAVWNLVYRDLKPGNIMLGPHHHAYLIDFGGCRLTVNDRQVHAGAHTRGYCPPECIEAGAVLTTAADSYTVGSTLFHLLTGLSPLTFLPPEARRRGDDDDVVRRWDMDLLARRVKPEVRHFVAACLEEKPGSRPASGTILLDELLRLSRHL